MQSAIQHSLLWVLFLFVGVDVLDDPYKMLAKRGVREVAPYGFGV